MPDGMGITRPKTLRQRVENSLEEAIMSGRFYPGEHLTERELCESLGASRILICEALRKLEAERLVCIVPHKGPQVVVIR